jgi:hypothetical protein
VNILNELGTTVDPFVRAVGTKVDIPHGNGWSTSYLGWTITSNSGMYYADIKFGVVRYQSDNLNDIMEQIKARVTHQGYGVHWKQLQDELCANYNIERIERGAPLFMEYLGYKFYGKDDWWFACNDEHEYEIKPTSRELISAIERKEAWRKDAS